MAEKHSELQLDAADQKRIAESVRKITATMNKLEAMVGHLESSSGEIDDLLPSLYQSNPDSDDKPDSLERQLSAHWNAVEKTYRQPEELQQAGLATPKDRLTT